MSPRPVLLPHQRPLHRLAWPRCSPASASTAPLGCPPHCCRAPSPSPPHVTPPLRSPGASPQPEAPPTPGQLRQPPPTAALGRSVQDPAKPPQQRLRKAVESRAGRSGERRPRGCGRRRLRGQGRQGLQQIHAPRHVPRRRPRHRRGSRGPHRGSRLQRTFRSPPRSPGHRGGRGGRTNPAALHRTRMRKLRSPPRGRQVCKQEPGRPAAPAAPRRRGLEAGAGPPTARVRTSRAPAWPSLPPLRSWRRALQTWGGGVLAEQEGLGGCRCRRKPRRNYAGAAPLRRGSLWRRGFPRPWEEDCRTQTREHAALRCPAAGSRGRAPLTQCAGRRRPRPHWATSVQASSFEGLMCVRCEEK